MKICMVDMPLCPTLLITWRLQTSTVRVTFYKQYMPDYELMKGKGHMNRKKKPIIQGFDNLWITEKLQ
jgi:hypothetical protein